MSAPGYQPAVLDDSRVHELQSLETRMGRTLVALQPRPAYAELSRDEIAKLKEAEQQLGVVLLAYDS